MNFTEDSFLADMKFYGVVHNIGAKSLCILISPDDYLAAESMELNLISAFNVSLFQEQNVISHIEYTFVDNYSVHDFVNIANKEISTPVFRIHNEISGMHIGLIVVPSNGATIYAVCESVNIFDVAKNLLHSIKY